MLEGDIMKKDVNERLIWLGGEILNVNDAKINVLSPTSHYGLNVFEGIRCYWNNEKKQLYAFRLEDHHNRLLQSIKLLQIKNEYSKEMLVQSLVDIIKANDYKEDIAVRQTVFVDGFGSWASEESVNMFIAPIPKAKTNPEYNKKGLHCCVSSWQRINDNSISPRIKCGANYMNSRMAQREAIRNGYDSTIILNNQGKVSEGPGSCLFIVKKDVLITPLLTDSVLESITRDTIIKIAKGIGVKVEERTVVRTELYVCDEAFLCGSAMEITPIYSVDRYQIGNGDCGKLTGILHKEYLSIVTNENEKYKHWLTPIY